MSRFIFMLALLCMGSTGFASWSDQALKSASASPSGAAKQSCVAGFNQSKERREVKAYDQHQGYSSKCVQGESWGTCLRRLYFKQ